MQRIKPWQSVVTRLVVSLLVGGVIISAGLSLLEMNRAERTLRIDVAKEASLTVRNAQNVLRDLLDDADADQIANALSMFATSPAVQALRLVGEDIETGAGDWPELADGAAKIWTVRRITTSSGSEVSLNRPTLVLAPFEHRGERYLLELLLDGGAMRDAAKHRIAESLATQWLFLMCMTLAGLVLLRRYFTGPLLEVVAMLGADPGPESFRRLAEDKSGEFSVLAQTIGDMLARIQEGGRQLAQRERAFQSLYHFAPAAMLSIDAQGRIVEANRRAAFMLGVAAEEKLLDRTGLEFVTDEDRPLLRQTIERLSIDDAARCHLRVRRSDGHQLDVAVEAAAVRGEDGVPVSVRLSLLDVSAMASLQRALEDKSRLMNLIIDHMSDAIVLIGADGKVAAFNQQLATLLHRRGEALQGAPYSHDAFWEQLGVEDRPLFVSRMKQIEADQDRPAQERFRTRSGTFLFQGIPVHDAARQQVGRLWVVQETTQHEQSQRLVKEQHRQLQALKQVAHVLGEARTLDEVLEAAAGQLYELLEVDAVGLALRREHLERRCTQVLHRGMQPYLLATHQALLAAVAKSLMPVVLPYEDVAFWPDPPASTVWGKAFAGAGLTSVAACPVKGAGDAQGLIWIARRGGERLERHHIHMLATLAPVIAARLQVVELQERMVELELHDAGTGLPSAEQFRRLLARLPRAAGEPFAVCVIEVDRFETVTQGLEPGEADDVVRILAQRIGLLSRRSSLLARLGPGTLGLVTPRLPAEAAERLAERLRTWTGAEELTLEDGRTMRVTLSVGAACSPSDGVGGAEVHARAAARAEQARRLGGDRVVCAEAAGRQVG